jgi:hypothetical protein
VYTPDSLSIAHCTLLFFNQWITIKLLFSENFVFYEANLEQLIPNSNNTQATQKIFLTFLFFEAPEATRVSSKSAVEGKLYLHKIRQDTPMDDSAMRGRGFSSRL